MANYTTTVYTSNGAKAINRDLSWADAKIICEKASESGYAEVTYGKEVMSRSVFVPNWATELDRSHL
jgi:hypothetical protein